VELNRTRHLFEDISCLKQKIDLRMVLYAKKIRLEKLTVSLVIKTFKRDA
ncbi:hypothetical protein Csa_006643, partial [Cucumis sativus]